ncbi:MAG: alpha-glucosidase [Eubacterium sp.]
MKTRWYKDAVVYQIYPRSFNDSNGDGIGDIKGITEKVDYIKNLGVDAVWLSPCYKSPNDDNGYDISDYRDIMDEFGTLSDWEEMLNAFHAHDIKVIMDLVVNHTSDEHKWFEESRKSKDNPYRDYYIWRDGTGKDKKNPPNNWRACFGSSAWEYDETTGQFYLHLFSKKQPDLNWENPKVRKEVQDICNYWFEKGVDGFRCDVITYVSKPDDLYHAKQSEVVVGPRWKQYINELCRNSWDKYDTLIVGEAIGIDYKRACEITKECAGLLDMLFHFEHVGPLPVCSFSQKFTFLRPFKKTLSKWQGIPDDCWGAVYYENHDQPRSLPRFAPTGKHRVMAAKSLATSLLFQKGTPFIYQGQELGMTNCDYKYKDYRDIQTINKMNSIEKIPFGKLILPIVMFFYKRYARDNARTPMQWDSAKNAGFTMGTPWAKINDNYTEINAAEEIKNPNSVLNFYKKALKVRKEYADVIRDGKYIPVNIDDNNVFAYIRDNGEQKLFVVCSLSPKKVNFKPHFDFDCNARVILSNTKNPPMPVDSMTLKPCECAVYELI